VRSLNDEQVDLQGLDTPESPRPGARGVTSYIMSQETGILVKSGAHDNVVRANTYRPTGAGYDGPDQIGSTLISAQKHLVVELAFDRNRFERSHDLGHDTFIAKGEKKPLRRIARPSISFTSDIENTGNALATHR
jgi:hypothetical protein